MINKQSIFAAGGAQDPIKTEANFREGMIPNTVAMAEDVNTYGNMSDKDLWAVCQELRNLLLSYDERVPNNTTGENDYEESAQFQLANLFRDKLPGAKLLTGIDRATYTSAPVQVGGNLIQFPQMNIVFNNQVYYGTTRSTLQRTTLAAQDLTANASWETGVHFIYASTVAGSNVATLGHQTEPVSAADGATKCYLGSVFVINGAFQPSTWKFQPWLQITSVENRETPTARTKGGFVSPLADTMLQMGALEINDEGLNFDSNPLMPNIMNVEAKSPFTYKYLHPKYDASQLDVEDVDTTHIYNITSGEFEEIPDEIVNDVNPHFIVIVPCITPAGQTLLIPAMSEKVGTTYTQIFDSQEEAVNSIFSLQYSLVSEDGADVTARVIYLGQSLIVKVGATDFSDPTQFMTIGMLPQALGSFTSAAGQAGGGISTYRPMPSISWAGYSNVVCQNNAANVIFGSTATAVTVSMPTPRASIINQLELHYVHEEGMLGIEWGTTIKWWTGVAPQWIAGVTYNIIFEYIYGAWYASVLAVA